MSIFSVREVEVASRLLGVDTSHERRAAELGLHYENFQREIALFESVCQSIAQGAIPDPTVGENACQIRAFVNAEIAGQPDFISRVEETLGRLQAVQKRFSECLFSFESKRIAGKTGEGVINFAPPVSTHHFFESLQVNVSMDAEVAFIVVGMIVERLRPMIGYAFRLKDGLVDVIPEEAKPHGEITAAFRTASTLQKFSKVFKAYLAEESVRFVQEAAASVSLKEESQRLSRMVAGDRVRKTQQGLLTVPCFSASQALLYRAAARGTPLVVRIYRVDALTAKVEGTVKFFFAPVDGDYQPVRRDAIEHVPAVVLCNAVSAAHPAVTEDEVMAEIGRHRISDLMLAFMATHPVYGGSQKCAAGDPEELETLKPFAARALEIGCCIENQRICRLFHMLAVPTKTVFTEET